MRRTLSRRQSSSRLAPSAPEQQNYRSRCKGEATARNRPTEGRRVPEPSVHAAPWAVNSPSTLCITRLWSRRGHDELRVSREACGPYAERTQSRREPHLRGLHGRGLKGIPEAVTTLYLQTLEACCAAGTGRASMRDVTAWRGYDEMTGCGCPWSRDMRTNACRPHVFMCDDRNASKRGRW
jgi:hypothetical protein